MKCPECGANLKKISPRCEECGAQLKDKTELVSSQKAPAPESAPVVSVKPKTAKSTPSLIEFPGINRNVLPEWRKELSERVREKQERKAREAVLESQGLVATAVDTATEASPVILELLPQTEMPPVNPIVEAALKRIERANLQPSSFSRGNAALATAVAYEEQRGFAESHHAPSIDLETIESNSEASDYARPEKVHNLSVVPNPVVVEEEAPVVITKPRRLISDTNDPALNYLDTVPTTVLVERREYVAASSVLRALAAFVDLGIVGALASPLLALNSLTNLDWQNWRVIAFSATSIALVGFLYLTIVTAFTGRTLGMRLCGLRVVDARNGLIPTGGQAAARALVYLLSLVPAGILSLYVFVDRENKTIHDRLTRTAVIRA